MAVSRFQITCRPLGFPVMTRSTFSLPLWPMLYGIVILRLLFVYEDVLRFKFRPRTALLPTGYCAPRLLRLMQCARFVLLFRRSCDRSLDAPAVQYHLLPPMMLVSDRPYSFQRCMWFGLLLATYVYPVISIQGLCPL